MAEDKRTSAETLAGEPAGSKPKVPTRTQFPVTSLEGVLAEIRRAGGTGKLEINFRNGHARGEAKWQGFSHRK